jgi:hypothetical protein
MMWRDIPGYEGIYQINESSTIKSLSRQSKRGKYIVTLKEKYLITHDNGNGYLVISLSKNSKVKTHKVHQLMAITFLDYNKQNKLVIDHIDNNSKNNSLYNLRVVLQNENCLSSNKQRKHSFQGICQTKNSQWTASIRINGKRKFLGNYNTPEEAQTVYFTHLNSLKNDLFNN